MRRVVLFSVCLAIAPLFSVAPGASPQQPSTPSPPTSCDEASIKADSYRLTTEAQALNVLRPRQPWWEPYGLWAGPREIGDINEGSTRLAERARELDDRNLLAHGYLARQYVVMGIDAATAEQEWTRVLDHGGAVVWTATLYDIDPRSYFVLAFDRQRLRIFRFGQIAGALRTHFGVPDFPGPDRPELWRALGGCLPANVAPEAEIRWSQVREIEAMKWSIRLELTDEVAIRSDRGNRRTDDRVDVALHGQAADLDYRLAMTPWGWRPYYLGPQGVDPANYPERAKHMLVKMFELRSKTD